MELFAGLEDTDEASLFLQETAIDFARTVLIPSTITVDTIISSTIGTPNGFSELICTINSSVTVTVLDGSSWLIGSAIPSSQEDVFSIILEPGNDESFNAFHDHSLSEWKNIWSTQHQNTDPFPTIFISLTNKL
jgi:hypothetical protein